MTDKEIIEKRIIKDKEIIEKRIIKGKEIIAKRIINGLRYCEVEYPPCAHCPYRISGLNLCKKHLIADAYYLVKTQQKEIERLTNYNRCIDAQCRDLLDKEEKIRAEAIKEFAEKLKKLPVPYHSDIDNLVKEMVGAENEDR